nr:hypothetical protein [Prevotella sp.]
MKKLFFAVSAAAFVFVSANNVFASNKMISTSAYEPTDTVAPADTTETTTDSTTEKPAEASLVMSLSDIEPTDTVAPAETPAPADTTNTPADSTAEQAQ